MTQIGAHVWTHEDPSLGSVSSWGPRSSHGRAKSKQQFLSLLPRLSIELWLKPLVRLNG